jgi:hypothetical protein
MHCLFNARKERLVKLHLILSLEIPRFGKDFQTHESAGDKADAALAAASLALVSLMPPPPGAVDTWENAVTLPVVEAHDPKFHLLFIFP